LREVQETSKHGVRGDRFARKLKKELIVRSRNAKLPAVAIVGVLVNNPEIDQLLVQLVADFAEAAFQLSREIAEERAGRFFFGRRSCGCLGS